jgi:hypothetical protein
MTITVPAVTFPSVDRFDTLPAELAASCPAEARGLARDEVRLYVADHPGGTHARFRELPTFLRPGDLLVVNDSATLSAAVDIELDGPRPCCMCPPGSTTAPGWPNPAPPQACRGRAR